MVSIVQSHIIRVASFFPSSLSYSDSFEEGIEEEEMYSITVFIILQRYILCFIYIVYT